MPVATIILLVAWCGVCSVWIGLIIAQARARRDGLFLEVAEQTHMDALQPEAAPSLCVVIAARNESDGLAACLRNVLAQDYPAMSVLVVDDRSEDDTLAIAQQFAQSDSRVRAEHIDTLPRGWMGKSHALWHGTRSARADWLLFMDVDCTLKPRAISRAVEEARHRNVQVLTLWPRQAAGGFWEHATIPLCGGIIALWFGSQRINDPGSTLAFANGQFLLFERQAYEQVRGHEAVRRAIIEDIPLAEHAKRSGLSCWVASGRDLVSVRMYENYRGIRDGWARIFVGSLRSGVKIAASIAWLIVGSLLPYIAGIVLAVRVCSARAGGEDIRIDLVLMAALCMIHLAAMMLASYRFWGMGGCRRIDLLWYPLSVCVVVRILARSWWWLMISRSIPWRDTHYAIDRRGRIVE